MVYGPQGDTDKLKFLQEIKQIKQAADNKWLLLGDFNLIYRASDKNNGRVNRRLMSSFRWILDEFELKELYLHGRRFTWTSATDNPTLNKIDHVFCTREWELKHPHCHLQALGSSVSGHCPMVLSCAPLFIKNTMGSDFKHGGYECTVSRRQCNNPGRSQSTLKTRPECYT
jgi:endonuclease/exonuclease/phosphatase family metal-dependent hydrolase